MQFQGRKSQGIYQIIGQPILPGIQSASVATSYWPQENDNDSPGLGGAPSSSCYSVMQRWHARLGHANTESIKKLIRSDAVTGLSARPNHSHRVDCDSCVKGKQARETLRTNYSRSQEPGAVIHTDVCGPMSVSSFSGCNYYVSFIDEYTGYISIFPIMRKSDVLNKFKLFHPWLERKFKCTLKRVYSDRGGEYIALRSYLEDKGIEHTMSPSYSPNQNGIAERANRTIVECARTMLEHAGLPRTFWAEAVVHASKIRNHFLAPRQNDVTSLELITGQKPDVSYFRTFGCLGWHHIPKELRRKLDSKSELGIVVGCFANSQYKLWIPARNVAVLSRDVTIVEDTFPAREWKAHPDNHGLLFDGEEGKRNTSHAAPLPANDMMKNLLSGKDNEPISQPHIEKEIVTQPDDEQRELMTYFPPTPESTTDERNTPPHEAHHDAHDTREGRYPRREHHPPSYYKPGSANVAKMFATLSKRLPNPSTLEEALAQPDGEDWKEAIASEMESLAEHGTWEAVSRPRGAKVLSTKFVFLRKYDEHGSVVRHKARLFVRGFQQGDIDQTFAPVVDFITVRTCLAIAIKRGYVVEQLDIRTAFLHGVIDGEVYVTPPNGLDICQHDEVLKLHRGLYGLKQAPRLWHEKWDSVMAAVGFTKLVSDDCVYRRGDVWLLLYVDDIIMIGTSDKAVRDVKTELMPHLDVQDLGTLKSFLGVLFVRDEFGAWLSQQHYISQVLERFGMQGCKPVTTPMTTAFVNEASEKGPLCDKSRYQELLGCLLFISTRTRPDISLSLSLLCRYASQPTIIHWSYLKRILRYLNGTKIFALRIHGQDDATLLAFCDANWAGDPLDGKSTTGVVLRVGLTTVAWRTQKQKSVALSTTEAEFMALSEGLKLVLWLRFLLDELDCAQMDPTVIKEDNQGAVTWGQEGVRHAKHVSIRKNFVKENVQKGSIQLEYCATNDMTADVLTKPLLRLAFDKHRDELGVLDLSAPAARGSFDVGAPVAHFNEHTT